MIHLKTTFLLILFVFTVLQVHAQQQLIFLQLNKNDSLAKALEGKKFTANEWKYHQMIWRLKGIRQKALELNKKGVMAFTMTDDWPSDESIYYIISFYEMAMTNKSMERYSRLITYRINKRMKIEIYNVENDAWTSLN